MTTNKNINLLTELKNIKDAKKIRNGDKENVYDETINCETCSSTLNKWLADGDRVSYCGSCGEEIDWRNKITIEDLSNAWGAQWTIIEAPFRIELKNEGSSEYYIIDEGYVERGNLEYINNRINPCLYVIPFFQFDNILLVRNYLIQEQNKRSEEE